MIKIPKKYDVMKERVEYRDGNPYYLVNIGSRVRAGTIAGCINNQGYRMITCTIDGKSYSVKSSRLSFYIHYGYLPEVPLIVDHINQIKSDDRPENLRSGTISQNNRNSSKRQNTTSKFIGVSYHIPTNKWQARIKINYEEIYIGVFHSERDAARVRDLQIKEYGLEEWTTLNFDKDNYQFIPETIFHPEPMYQPNLFDDLVLEIAGDMGT